MNRRYRKSSLYSHLCRNLLIIGLSFGALTGVMQPSSVLAQESAIDVVMKPESGEKAGQLAKGELLVNAMKREKVDNKSAHDAIKSIGTIFDFRLSRSGDRYVFRLTNGQKLAMLRYQRGPNVYETVLDSTTGEYKAEIINLKKVKIPTPSKEAFVADEDGEVDVEHAAMADQIHVPVQADNVADVELNALEKAAPDDPVLPEDQALAGKPSPDAEFPDIPMQPEDTGSDDESFDLTGDNLAEENTGETVVMPNIPKQPNQIVEENTYQNEPYRGPIPQIRQKKSTDNDVPPFSTPFSMISLVMFVLGLFSLVGAFLMCILPGLKAHRRVTGVGLSIHDSILIAPGHTLACVELNGQGCLIAIHPETMSFIAPCPLDDEVFWTKLRAKTYWHKMSKTPLSDRQLVALLAEIQKPAKQVKTLPSMPKSALQSEDESYHTTANAIPNEEIDDTPDENEEIDDTPDEEDTVYR